jgi:N-acetylglucosamine-6-phosphate deacetylase
VDFGNAVLAPGLIDIHIHGSAGRDVMDADPGALHDIGGFLAKHGVTSFFPTTVTAPLDKMLAALERLARAIEMASKSGANSAAGPAGIHLEGPFLSHVRRGVHPPVHLLKPSVQVFEQFWEASHGQIRLITIAPEMEGALEVIKAAVARGICVSLGHSDADLATTRAAVAAGARHATHTFNAMRPLNHREPGILGEVLTDGRISADIIADGIHVDPVIVDLFLQAKGEDAALLITDAISATGMPNGRYRLGSFEVDVKDGTCLADGKLAGSVLTLDGAVRNVMKFAGWKLQNALRLASANPARVTGISSRKGALVPGADADICVFSPKGEVQQAIIAGKLA